MSDEHFIGFFWTYLPQREDLEHALFHFYRQLLRKLDYYEKYQHESVLSGTGPVRIILNESHMVLERSPSLEPAVSDTPLGFLIFRGDYMRVFQEGAVLLDILKAMLQSYGQTEELVALTAKLANYEECSRKTAKGNASLRAFCWYLDRCFISHFPAEYRVAFTMDCLLYSEWRISHPNVVGLHMLALAWMMDVREFDRFLPDGLRPCPVIVEPPYAKFLDIVQIQISTGGESTPSAKAVETDNKISTTSACT